jgi:hypothetical protein
VASNGKLAGALGQLVPAFERLNGRTPTAEEQKEALAFLDVVKSSGVDPFLLFFLLDRRGAEGRERALDQTRAVMDEAASRIEATSASAAQRMEAAAARVEAGGLSTKARSAIELGVKTWVAAGGPRAPWRWPLTMAAAACFVFALLAVSLSSSVATRNGDRALARELSTSQGVAALGLAQANWDLARMLASCPREVDAGQVIMTCRLRPIGTQAPVARPTWISTAQAVVAGWSSLWLAAGLAVALIAIALLGWIKRGPAKRRIA